MVLNTSFNLKNQPIVEGPEDAVKALLASEGRLSALFIGLFEVTLRPFPFSDLEAIAAESGMRQQGDKDGQGAGALLEAELGVIVRAKKFYMLEMVSSSGAGAGAGADVKPLRIRIQGPSLFLCCLCSPFYLFSFATFPLHSLQCSPSLSIPHSVSSI
jgi:Carbamoyltransferase C-terminus